MVGLVNLVSQKLQLLLICFQGTRPVSYTGLGRYVHENVFLMFLRNVILRHYASLKMYVLL